MFLEEGGRRPRFPERAFDALVARRKLHKVVSPWTITTRDGKDHRYRRVFYALPGEDIEHAYRMQSAATVVS